RTADGYGVVHLQPDALVQPRDFNGSKRLSVKDDSDGITVVRQHGATLHHIGVRKIRNAESPATEAVAPFEPICILHRVELVFKGRLVPIEMSHPWVGIDFLPIARMVKGSVDVITFLRFEVLYPPKVAAADITRIHHQQISYHFASLGIKLLVRLRKAAFGVHQPT